MGTRQLEAWNRQTSAHAACANDQLLCLQLESTLGLDGVWIYEACRTSLLVNCYTTRIDLVAQLYSFTHNTRLRLKISLGAAEQAYSLTGIWPTANWLEREIFDLFGIEFLGHPGLKRILLPDEWQGHPLRKDYDILQQDTAWVRENLGIESGQ